MTLWTTVKLTARVVLKQYLNKHPSVPSVLYVCVCVCLCILFTSKSNGPNKETDKCKKALSWRQRRQDSRIKDTDMFINTEEIC